MGLRLSGGEIPLQTIKETDMEKMLQILVVLVPIAIFVVIGFVALEHKVRVFIKAQLQVKEQLELHYLRRLEVHDEILAVF